MPTRAARRRPGTPHSPETGNRPRHRGEGSARPAPQAVQLGGGQACSPPRPPVSTSGAHPLKHREWPGGLCGAMVNPPTSVRSQQGEKWGQTGTDGVQDSPESRASPGVTQGAQWGVGDNGPLTRTQTPVCKPISGSRPQAWVCRGTFVEMRSTTWQSQEREQNHEGQGRPTSQPPGSFLHAALRFHSLTPRALPGITAETHLCCALRFHVSAGFYKANTRANSAGLSFPTF